MKIFTPTYFALLITLFSSVVHVEAEALVNNDSAVSIASLDESTHLKSWHFNAYLDDDLIGFHTFKMQKKLGETTIISEAEFDIRFIFITVYSYTHNNTEIWSNDCLKRMSAITDDNGEELSVNLFKEEGISYIEAGKIKVQNITCVRSFAYWDLELIKSNRLLNSQTGELIDISFNYIGTEDYKLNDNLIETEHYRLLGNDQSGKEIEIDLWYAQGNQWVALKSKLDNGNTLRYQLSAGVPQ